MASGFRIIVAILISCSICDASFGSVPCTYPCAFGKYDEIILNCENGVCACKADWLNAMADASFYEVKQEGDSCTVGNRAPCGVSNGLEISCRGTAECLNGICRERSEFGTAGVNHSCIDNQDCVTGLVCKMVRFQYRETYECVTPETPAYKSPVGFE